PFSKARPTRYVLNKEAIAYDEIRRFLPTNILVSAFSIHGEYPAKRPNNFIGDRIVTMYDVAHIYGRNHYALPSLSSSILRLMTLWISKDHGTSLLEHLLNAKLTGRVLIRDMESFPDETRPIWTHFNSNISRSAMRHEIYLNDVEFVTQGNNVL